MSKYDVYLKNFEDIIGLNLISTDNEISVVNLPNVISKISPESINDLISPMKNLIKEVLPKESHIEQVFLKRIIAEKYIYKLINSNADHSILSDFVNNLQILSDKTYEQDNCKMGFIVFKNPKDNIRDELNKLCIDYIPFKDSIALSDLSNIKSSLKIVDSLSVCYVVDDKYKVKGLAKKRKYEQSITSIMTNRYQKENENLLKFNMLKYSITHNSSSAHEETENIKKLEESINTNKIELLEIEQKLQGNLDSTNSKIHTYVSQKEKLLKKLHESIYSQIEIMQKKNKIENIWTKKLETYFTEKTTKSNENIQFVQINSNKIEWFINNSLICTLSNGKWNVKNYELISYIILEFILRQYSDDKVMSEEKSMKLLNEIIPRFHILLNNIKQLSKKNIGALVILLKKSTQNKKTIYKKLLTNGELDENQYKSIIKTKADKQININSCDNYLFELICSVDGALLLDTKMNILSFGEMINNSLETPAVAEAGSRTLAAAKASLFGLGIKVSEDGDISIFEKGSPIIKL